MANEKQLAILKQGVVVWNAWRKKNPCMLRAGGLRWTGVLRPGSVHREPEGNRGVKFGVRWPFA